MYYELDLVGVCRGMGGPNHILQHVPNELANETPTENPTTGPTPFKVMLWYGVVAI